MYLSHKGVTGMDSYWINEFNDEDILFSSDESEDAFYCPYTNGPQCALLCNGWQPQELCETLECEQLKLLKRNRKKHAA
jgi:hypothetical protein